VDPDTYPDPKPWEGVIPQDWKEANVTPIFKKGSKSSPGNYIPVSLTNAINKHLADKKEPAQLPPGPVLHQ
jgi:hypothetical protein